jgi:geranylgeranyl diphosphate synthase type I
LDLEKVLREQAKIFDSALNGNLAHREPQIFYDALRWIPLSGGKRLRPIITMLACEAVGGVPENTIPLGISLEYMHNSTLIHDDIIDNDKWRRGMLSTHEKFGLPHAIIAGDALIGETYRMLSYMAPPELKAVTYKEIIRAIADAAKNFYEGEAMDIEFAHRFDVSIPEYMVMIEKKTAQLYWVAGKGGALIGKGSDKEVTNLAIYGKLFGLMFQIKDDLLNILTDQTALGKQKIGSDIPNGKRTLMVIHSLTQINRKTRERLLQILGNSKASQNDIFEAIEIFKEAGSIDYCLDLLQEYRNQAHQALAILKPSDSKILLEKLADYSITRKY